MNNLKPNAIYTCKTVSGRVVEVQGHTDWEIRDIKRVAETAFGEPIKEVIQEKLIKSRTHA